MGAPTDGREGTMEIRLLGPVELLSERGPVPIGSAKQRALLAFLALHPQRLLTYEVLIDGLWGDDPPDETIQALRFHVSRLRGVLRQVDDADRLRTRPGGYQLVLPDDAVDVLRFERAVAEARRARSDGASPDMVSRAFQTALGLWVGPALADINGEPFVVGERRRLEELRLAATEDYLAAELAGSRHAEAVGELERLIDRHPLRERLWELLMTALYRSGRQADALAAYQRLRRILADELGIEPSAPLRELEHKVLIQDTGLAAPSTAPGPVSPSDRAEPPTDAVPEEPRPPAGATGRASRGLVSVALVLGVVLVLAGIGVAYRRATAGRETADRDTAAGVSEEPEAGRPVPLSTLHIGDCFDLSSTASPLPETVSLVECEQPHLAEVFHRFMLVPGPYPGEAEVEALALQQCSTAFESYVGVSPDQSGLAIRYVRPGRDQWESGNRSGGCALMDAAERDLTGSMLGEGR